MAERPRNQIIALPHTTRGREGGSGAQPGVVSPLLQSSHQSWPELPSPRCARASGARRSEAKRADVLFLPQRLRRAVCWISLGIQPPAHRLGKPEAPRLHQRVSQQVSQEGGASARCERERARRGDFGSPRGEGGSCAEGCLLRLLSANSVQFGLRLNLAGKRRTRLEEESHIRQSLKSLC